MSAPNIMDNYVPVNERIEQFLEKYPDGSLQSEIVELSESRVVVRAYAYRSADDPKPGMGHSSLTIPGKTTFTRDSEIENCETSAWGRAIAALGFEVKRGIASAEEVANKTVPSRPAPEQRPVTPARPHVVNTAVAEVDDEDWLPPADALGTRAGGTDTVTCPIHGVAWAGKPGDLFHKDGDKWCRHPDNIPKARAR